MKEGRKEEGKEGSHRLRTTGVTVQMAAVNRGEGGKEGRREGGGSQAADTGGHCEKGCGQRGSQAAVNGVTTIMAADNGGHCESEKFHAPYVDKILGNHLRSVETD